MSTNIQVLTHGHAVTRAKRRARNQQISQIVFDDSARREFLTGFHKRKLAKAEAARAKAKEREKQQRMEARREQRQTLRQRAIENAAEVERAYGGAVEEQSEEEWAGISASRKSVDGERDEEYEDEELLATVTVVEDFDPDTISSDPAKRDRTFNVHPHLGTTSKKLQTRSPSDRNRTSRGNALRRGSRRRK